jgi:hypothetical protein
VVLSDHGQSQGTTFADRYGVTLDRLARGACGLSAGVDAPPSDGPLALAGGLLARRLREHAPDLEHQSGGAAEAARVAAEQAAAAEGLLVLASGSLGLIYLTRLPGRLTLERIQAVQPDLLSALVDHPGVGFVLVDTEDGGPVALGRDGAHFLAEGRVVGTDPLVPYGPLTVPRLLRADGFAHMPDLLVSSRYDPQTDEVAAFEPLVGSHGGVGGPQTTAFLLHPVDLSAPPEPLFGAEQVHRVLRGWLASLGHAAYAPPVEEDAAAPAEEDNLLSR